MGQVIRFILDAVKTTDVEREVKLRIDFEVGDIADEKLGFYVLRFELATCNLDGAGGKIYTCDLPASFGKRDDIRARAAAEINGAACGMGLDEFKKFGRGDAAIPGRLSEIPKVKSEAAQEIHLRESRTL